MRRPLTFTSAFFFGLCGSFSLQAQEHSIRYEKEDPRAQGLIELVAEDFYENNLSAAQSRRIEAYTASHYATLTAKERAEFQKRRRAQWHAMSESDRDALRNAKTPQYENLTPEQQSVFKAIAERQLGANDSAETFGKGEI